MRRKSATTRKGQREMLLDLFEEINERLNNDSKLTQDGRIKFNLHSYGDTEFDTRENMEQRVAEGELENAEIRYGETDIPFGDMTLGARDFGYYFEPHDWENDRLTDDEIDALHNALADILEKYELHVDTEEEEQGFGRYLPWYVGKKSPKEFEYGLKDITDLHPYSALKGDLTHNCSDNADLEIYEDDFIVMECNVCGRTATFRQEGPFEGPRRNPLTEPSHALGAGIVATALGAALFGYLNMRKGD